jgi:hypothetical protein
MILKNKGPLSTLCACMIGACCLLYMDPTLAVRLAEMGMGESGVGATFALMGLCFGLGSAFSGWICNKIPRLVVM